MSKPRRARFIALCDLLAQRHSEIDVGVIVAGDVIIDGRVLTNPRARVRADASVRVHARHRLRGDIKLAHALETFAVPVAGRVAIDVGASAGGFTTALLAAGASRVYAVEAGVGQLRGGLRVDPRVINLEGHNLGMLDPTVVPEPVAVVVMDLSYLSIAAAVPQLERLAIHPGADLIALVKPTFELHRAELAASAGDIAAAVQIASCALERAGWLVLGSCDAPATGQHGAREALIHARRQNSVGPPTARQ
jgi:23S rRNA (cytidine1920-2'-O)/16S rRNA (cytidine1409-2'-O)-methyltransferase